MNNPFDLLKLYNVAKLQEQILTEDANNNFDFSTLLSENDDIRKDSSVRLSINILLKIAKKLISKLQ